AAAGPHARPPPGPGGGRTVDRAGPESGARPGVGRRAGAGRSVMPVGDLALHVLALLIYPGLATMVLIGLAAEAGAAMALRRTDLRMALLVPAAGLRQAVRNPRDVAVPLLAALAATQLAVPLNPVNAIERNLVVAAIALLAVAWLLTIRTW